MNTSKVARWNLAQKIQNRVSVPDMAKKIESAKRSIKSFRFLAQIHEEISFALKEKRRLEE